MHVFHIYLRDASGFEKMVQLIVSTSVTEQLFRSKCLLQNVFSCKDEIFKGRESVCLRWTKESRSKDTQIKIHIVSCLLD